MEKNCTENSGCVKKTMGLLQGWIEINKKSGQQVLKDLKRVEDLEN